LSTGDHYDKDYPLLESGVLGPVTLVAAQAVNDRSLAAEFTPNLDRLGRESVRFMQAYTCSWCAPSRQNLLSGRWCNRADNVQRPWIGKQLRNAGYRG
jgi:arylsulfatase A-like enzyme